MELDLGGIILCVNENPVSLRIRFACVACPRLLLGFSLPGDVHLFPGSVLTYGRAELLQLHSSLMTVWVTLTYWRRLVLRIVKEPYSSLSISNRRKSFQLACIRILGLNYDRSQFAFRFGAISGAFVLAQAPDIGKSDSFLSLFMCIICRLMRA